SLMPEKPVAEVKQIFQPSTELIKALEILLEEHKRGELRAIGYACVYADGLGSQGWSTEAGVYCDKLLSRITSLKAMYTANFGD
ncbi:hypothetical protein, partial [Salmonella enterica]|uniref:hypothetical protein n=1 Tax=Salmonella enterica TaxID=28901 RepID=UPI003296D870